MTRATIRLFCICVLAAISTALAAPDNARACGPNIEVFYEETAPTDVFSIHNRSQEPWTLVSLTISLGSSQGALFFDTEAGGLGESVAQPFAPFAGDAQLIGAPAVSDGDSVMLMLFSGFAPGQSFWFGIDIDGPSDPTGVAVTDSDPTHVSGDEMSGAKASGVLRAADGREIEARGTFNPDNEARLTALSCV